ncbi:MAG: ankyrin repeat domain-containing protein [Parashewanella sp.]
MAATSASSSANTSPVLPHIQPEAPLHKPAERARPTTVGPQNESALEQSLEASDSYSAGAKSTGFHPYSTEGYSTAKRGKDGIKATTVKAIHSDVATEDFANVDFTPEISRLYQKSYLLSKGNPKLIQRLKVGEKLHSVTNVGAKDLPFGEVATNASKLLGILEDPNVDPALKNKMLEQLAAAGSSKAFGRSSCYRPLHTFNFHQAGLSKFVDAANHKIALAVIEKFIQLNPSLDTEHNRNELLLRASLALGFTCDIGSFADADILSQKVEEFYFLLNNRTAPVFLCSTMVETLSSQLNQLDKSCLDKTADELQNGSETQLRAHQFLLKVAELSGEEVYLGDNKRLDVEELKAMLPKAVARKFSVVVEVNPEEARCAQWGSATQDEFVTVGHFHYMAGTYDGKNELPITLKYFTNHNLLTKNDDVEASLISLAIDQTTKEDEIFEFAVKLEQHRKQENPHSVKLSHELYCCWHQQLIVKLSDPKYHQKICNKIDAIDDSDDIDCYTALVVNEAQAVSLLNKADALGADLYHVVRELSPSVAAKLSQAELTKCSDVVQVFLFELSIQTGNESLFHALLAIPVRINEEVEGLTPLALTCLLGNSGFAFELLNHVDLDRNHPQHAAAALAAACVHSGCEEVFTHLLHNNSIDPNIKQSVVLDNREGTYPLVLASQKGHSAILRTLLAQKRLDLRIGQGELTAIHWAAMQGNLECVQILYPHFEEQYKSLSKDGVTSPEQMATLNKHRGVASFLNDKRGVTNRLSGVFASTLSRQPARKEFTTLASSVHWETESRWNMEHFIHESIDELNPDLLQGLINTGSDIDIFQKDPAGRSALDRAILMGYIPGAELNDMVCAGKYSRPQRQRLYELGRMLFEQEANSENGTKLKPCHFIHLIQDLTQPQKIAIFNVLIKGTGNGQSIEDLLASAIQLNVFAGAESSDIALRRLFINKILELFDADGGNVKRMVDFITKQDDVSLLREFIKTINDKDVIKACFDRLQTLGKLEQSDFDLCPLRSISYLTVEFLDRYCNCLPDILKRAIEIKDAEVSKNVMQLLVKTKLQLEQPLFDNTTPLMHACSCGNKAAVKLLLSMVKVTDDQAEQLVALAAKNTRFEVTQYLMHVFTVNPQAMVTIDGVRKSITNFAIESKDLNIVTLLINEPFIDLAVIENADTGVNPLWEAISSGDISVLIAVQRRFSCSFANVKFKPAQSSKKLMSAFEFACHLKKVEERASSDFAAVQKRNLSRRDGIIAHIEKDIKQGSAQSSIMLSSHHEKLERMTARNIAAATFRPVETKYSGWSRSKLLAGAAAGNEAAVSKLQSAEQTVRQQIA